MLKKEGRNLREQFVYSLQHNNGQSGNGRYTTEDLFEDGVAIRLDQEDLKNGKVTPESKSHPITG